VDFKFRAKENENRLHLAVPLDTHYEAFRIDMDQCFFSFPPGSTIKSYWTQLIDDMLNLSRVTRNEMNRETVHLSALARTIATELQKTRPERKMTFIIAEELFANGDASLLRAVLENLLGNAWKFTGRKARARIEFGVTQQDGKSVYFVRDDGDGFDPAYADKLFGVFQRLHGMTEFEGTGGHSHLFERRARLD
jgi:light-regulated signal transduction histidine kinase (bacteriophytochrome)